MQKKRRDVKNVYEWQIEERLNMTDKEREKKKRKEGRKHEKER